MIVAGAGVQPPRAFLVPAAAAVLLVALGGCSGGEPGRGAGWIDVPGGASFRGSPSYISEFQEDFRDNGGPVSDYGSHFGIKAEVEGRAFGGVRHYACVTGATFLDYTRTGLAGISTLSFTSAGETVLTEPTDRRITFEPFGWTEEAVDRGVRASMRTAFLETDAFFIVETVSNGTGAVLAAAPVFSFEARAARLQASFDDAANAVVLDFTVSLSLGTGRNWLAILPDFAIARLDADRSAGTSRLEGPSVEIPAGGSRTFAFFLGYSADSATDAIERARAARERAGADPEAAFVDVREEWESFFRGLPPPHTRDQRFVDLYRTSATALRMGLYAPRGAMDRYGAVPTKVHYNWMWLWDSGFQGLGLSEIDPALAEEVTWTVFQSQQEDGYIAHMTNEDLAALTPHSQSPVFGWTAREIALRDPDRARADGFVASMYEGSERFLAWWWANRDQDGDGLYEFLSQDESGWDNSPRRLYCGDGPNIPYFGLACELVAFRTRPLDSADLNPWLVFYYRAMAEWAERLGKPAQVAGDWRRRARDLGRRIDEVLWSDAEGAWFDAYGGMRGEPHTHWTVRTPAIWFPAFADTTSDLAKVRRVVEEHLLDPAEFFGRYPIPSVAYDDPYFDLDTMGWMGYVWLVTLYSALPTLYRYGYEDEAEELRRRALEMMAEQGGMHGVWETYSPATGGYKVEASTGSYTSFQFGWSAAFAMEIVLERHQRERFVFLETKRFEGYVKRASVWEGGAGEVFYEADAAGGYEVPRVVVESADGEPLVESRAIDVSLSDPWGSLETEEVTVTVAGQRIEARVGQTYRVEPPR